MAVILILMALLAIYSNVQKAHRDTIETVTIVPAPSASPSHGRGAVIESKEYDMQPGPTSLRIRKHHCGLTLPMRELCLHHPVTFALAVSCEKPQSEARKKNAQIDAECSSVSALNDRPRINSDLAQEQANLEAREKALAEKEAAADRVTATATPRDEEVPESSAQLSSSEDNSANSYDIFYRTLEPYGAWRESSDYGFVWQPREAHDVTGAHTRDGRWVYTDAGWTWDSERAFRLGHLSLRSLDTFEWRRLGLGSGRGMGARLGFMADERPACRLGSPSARSAFRAAHRDQEMGG